mmetsp:Transcript_58395/g.130148  ORF Transcript_58395/g.130148 Transcript_58395/m.130148 type:complete len:128 (-) Transcript_58395:2466-2849(-)
MARSRPPATPLALSVRLHSFRSEYNPAAASPKRCILKRSKHITEAPGGDSSREFLAPINPLLAHPHPFCPQTAAVVQGHLQVPPRRAPPRLLQQLPLLRLLPPPLLGPDQALVAAASAFSQWVHTCR